MMVTDTAKGTLLDIENGISSLDTTLNGIKTQVNNIKGSGADVATLKDIVNAITSNGGGGSGNAGGSISVNFDTVTGTGSDTTNLKQIKTSIDNLKGATTPTSLENIKGV